jgi:hypothetical protein
MSNHVTMSEAQLQQAIIELAHTLGYRCAHFRPALVKVGGVLTYRTPVSADGKGFFDLILTSKQRGRVIAIECKSGKGKLSPDQEVWRDEWAGEYYLVQPCDYLDETVTKILQQEAV